MQETTIQFETAKLLKDVGFPELNYGMGFTVDGYVADSTFTPTPYQCISQSLVERYIREKHYYIINVGWVYGKEVGTVNWYFNVKGINRKDNNPLPHNELRFPSYEKAKEEGLRQALVLIKYKEISKQ